MGCIVTKLEETQLTSIALSVFVMNLFKIQKQILCAFLHLIPVFCLKTSWKTYLRFSSLDTGTMISAKKTDSSRNNFLIGLFWPNLKQKTFYYDNNFS